MILSFILKYQIYFWIFFLIFSLNLVNLIFSKIKYLKTLIVTKVWISFVTYLHIILILFLAYTFTKLSDVEVGVILNLLLEIIVSLSLYQFVTKKIHKYSISLNKSKLSKIWRKQWNIKQKFDITEYTCGVLKGRYVDNFKNTFDGNDNSIVGITSGIGSGKTEFIKSLLLMNAITISKHYINENSDNLTDILETGIVDWLNKKFKINYYSKYENIISNRTIIFEDIEQYNTEQMEAVIDWIKHIVDSGNNNVIILVGNSEGINNWAKSKYLNFSYMNVVSHSFYQNFMLDKVDKMGGKWFFNNSNLWFDLDLINLRNKAFIEIMNRTDELLPNRVFANIVNECIVDIPKPISIELKVDTYEITEKIDLHIQYDRLNNRVILGIFRYSHNPNPTQRVEVNLNSRNTSFFRDDKNKNLHKLITFNNVNDEVNATIVYCNILYIVYFLKNKNDNLTFDMLLSVLEQKETYINSLIYDVIK